VLFSYRTLFRKEQGPFKGLLHNVFGLFSGLFSGCNKALFRVKKGSVQNMIRLFSEYDKALFRM